MIENPVYGEIYNNLATRYPKEGTDRKSDLNHLLSLQGSFCIFSDYRNGTTTLMIDLARRVDGIFVDSMSFCEGEEIEQLEKLLGNQDNPLLLDETTVFFRRLGYENAIEYLQKQSKKRQVGLRLHPENYSLRDDMAERGFQIVEIGKISYLEFKAIFDSRFEGTDFLLPEKFIKYAHNTYDLLAESVWYVAEAFRLMVEHPERKLSEADVKKTVELRYMWFGLK